MRSKIAVLALTTALLLSGCATTYQSLDDGWLPGGYTETRLAPNSWRVFFGGNGFSSRHDVQQLFFRRCAELSLEQGKRYFELSDHDAWMQVFHDAEGDVMTAPANEAIVTALDTDSGNAFDAVAIIEETNELAKGRLSARAGETLDKIKS